MPKASPPISFSTTLTNIGNWVILRLPPEASAQLPSRGQVMVSGSINDVPFNSPLEPDGNWSHWLHLDKRRLAAIKAQTGDTVTVSLQPSAIWIEPAVPADIKQALAASETAYALWQQITPMARWEWVRWIRSTGRDETRQRRIAVAISKLEHGKRRPCCWNRNLCTEPSISKNGVLLAG